MVLVLVVHSLNSVTATVPICMILLKDLLQKKQIPVAFKVRQIMPTSGAHSVSLWDVADKALLQEWLNANLGDDVTHEIQEVTEEFTFGLAASLANARTAEKIVVHSKRTAETISEKTKQAVHAAGTQFNKFDEKYQISEKTGKTFERMSTSAAKVKEKALENQTVATGVTAVGQGFQAGLKQVEKGFEWARAKMKRPGAINGNGNGVQLSPAPTSPVAQPNPIYNEVSVQNPVYGGQEPPPHIVTGVPASSPPIQNAPQTRQGLERESSVVSNTASPHAVDPEAVFSLGDENDDEAETGAGAKAQQAA